MTRAATAVHRWSHGSLLHDVSTSSVRSHRQLDAVVVPATRPAQVQRIITFAAYVDVPLVILCSKQARAAVVAARVEATLGARALVVDVPESYELDLPSQATSGDRFFKLSYGRESDLSLKRNLGLLIARLRGWRKILFVDDDIFDIRPQDVSRLAGQLDRYPVAAMSSREYPDNSVVCHAARAAGLPQDVFVSGAVLAVNTQADWLPFFPDVYNEDWFFFAPHAAERKLPKVGEVRQDKYQPYADPTRASREEFGDLLAEGLYAVFEGTPGWTFSEQLRAASSDRYWRRVIEDRAALIENIAENLRRREADGHLVARTAYSALTSLEYAAEQLALIGPADCVGFIDSWQADTRTWLDHLPRTGSCLSDRDALDSLGLTSWHACGYGAALKVAVSV